jgi:magnesium-transporting ATPase (P-type)
LNHESKTLTAYVKGAPEMIHSLSNSSTIPQDFFDVLEKYTQDGLRVLALGFRDYHNFGKKIKIIIHPKYSKFCRVFTKNSI